MPQQLNYALPNIQGSVIPQNSYTSPDLKNSAVTPVTTSVTPPAPTPSPGQTTLAQDQARAANQGKAGYDVFGNSTGAAGAAGSVGLSYSGISTADQQLNSNRDNAYAASNAPIDEGAIRAATLARYQAEIDQTNKIYANKLQEFNGQTTAANARSGIAGAVGAYDQNTNSGQNSIESARSSAVSEITNRANAIANDEIAQKQSAKNSGATQYVSYLTQANARREQNTQDFAATLATKGIDPSTLSTADLLKYAGQIGTTPEAIKQAYLAEKNALATKQAELDTKQAELTKTEADTRKPVGLPAGDGGYSYNPATGAYEQIQSANPTDATLKEYQYAVNNNGFTGSLADWKTQSANNKVTIGASRNPLTGNLETYDKSGPGVSSLPKPSSTGSKALPSYNGPVSLPKTDSTGNVVAGKGTGPYGLNLSNMTDANTLQYIQTGALSGKARTVPAFQQQIIARANEVIPGFNPTIAKANAGAIGKQTQFVADTQSAIGAADKNFKLLTSTLTGKINDYNSPLVNSALNSFNANYIGDKNAQLLKSAVAGLSSEYSLILARGGVRSVETDKSAQAVISGSYSMSNLQALADYVQQEGKNVVSARQDEIQKLSTYGGANNTPLGGTQGNTSATTTPTVPLTDLRSKYGY